MRVAFASAVSAVVHVLALGGLAMWAIDHGALEYRVVSGQAITVRFSLAAQSTPDEQPAEQPIKLEQSSEPLPPTQTPPEPPKPIDPPQRVEVQRQPAIVDMPAELVHFEASASDAAQEDLPKLAIAREQTPQTQPLITIRPRRAKPAAEPPPVAVAAIPLEFDAAAIAGASSPDELPRKLPLNPAPSYPSEALLAGIEGQVVLRVRIGGNGSVESLVVATSSGSRLLDDAAATTVRLWQFSPARKRGVPILFEALVPVTFRIRRS